MIAALDANDHPRNVTDYPMLGNRIGLEASYASGIVQLPDIGTRRLASIHGNPIIAPSRSERLNISRSRARRTRERHSWEHEGARCRCGDG